MTTVKSLSREMKFFLLALIPIYFISVGLIIQPFDSIVTGIYEIIWEPDFLITDYIAVGGMGACVCQCRDDGAYQHLLCL